MKPQGHGGRAAAKVVREKAIEKYYNNPVICKSCNKVIPLKENEPPREVRKRKFCNRECMYRDVGLTWARKPKPEKKERTKTLAGVTKGDLFQKRSGYQSARSSIQRHARLVYAKSDMPKNCVICGYAPHYEVCHIKAVSEFEDTALIVNDINCLANLVGLCPNHHWEYDHDLLPERQIRDYLQKNHTLSV